MSRWIQLMILIAAMGFTKAANFMRVVVMAGLGLAGLWMLHTLAQDFNSIMQGGFGSGGGGDHGTSKLFNNNNGESSEPIKVFKRSIEERQPQINWELVIKRDPASCARSFICQLAASKEHELVYEEKMILHLTEAAANNQTWAGKQLQDALKNGHSINYSHECMKIYRYCPYTKRMMMALLRVFGNR
ncbi:uncharacterized protein [Euwallacea similis]|uniref:uncharacterized protein n=1 Tax=Euwallacea similis TaxID=1736056 RepID=UPI0034503096